MADIFNPPAIVRPAEDVDALVAETKTVLSAISGAEKANVQRAMEAGDLLGRIKDQTGHGGFDRELKKLRISSQRASEYMRLAKSPFRGDLEKCLNISESLQELARLEAAQVLAKAQADPDYVPPELDARKPGQENWCGRCVRIGRQTAGCMACHASKTASPGPAKPKAESPSKYNERALWSKYNGFGNQVEAFAREHRLKSDPLYREILAVMKAVKAKFEELCKRVEY